MFKFTLYCVCSLALAGAARVRQLSVNLPVSKSSLVIRRCYQIAGLISLLSSLYFLKYPYLRKEPNYLLHFTFLSQQCPCHPGYCIFFLLSFHQGQFCRQCFFRLFVAFLHVGCWLFLHIICLSVSLVCPISILLNLTSYCLQLLCALSYSSMLVLMQCSLLVLFSHFLCHSVYLTLLMV